MRNRLFVLVMAVWLTFFAAPAIAGEPLEEVETYVNAAVCAVHTATDDKNVKDEVDELRPCLTRHY